MGNITYQKDMIAVTEKYLGPAAKRFIDRQISFHLEKSGDNLTKDDVLRLAEHIGTALGMLTNDKKSTKEAVDKIRSLVQ